MKFIWIEILKFLERNKVKLIAGILLIALFFVGSSYFNFYRSTQTPIENTEKIETTTEDTATENELVMFYPETEPANFYFFVETIDQTAFTNNLLLEQYITSPERLEEASSETNTNLDEVVESTGNKAYVDYNESGETKIIGVERNGNSHLLEFYVNIGNKTDNLSIANYFYERVTNNNIPLLNDKEVYVFQKPQIKEVDEISAFEGRDMEGATDEFNLVRDIILGLILGGIITIGVLLLMSFFSKKLVYSFSYSLKAEDYFFLVDNKLDYKDDLIQLLSNPKDSKHIVVREESIENSNTTLKALLANIEEFDSVLAITEPEKVDRLIYILEESKTSRNWYNQQRRLERIYEIPTVVIQVNKN